MNFFFLRLSFDIELCNSVANVKQEFVLSVLVNVVNNVRTYQVHNVRCTGGFRYIFQEINPSYVMQQDIW